MLHFQTAIDEELEYEGEAKRETSKDYRKQWRHISDMIHVALEECSHNYVSNISTVTGCQKYEGAMNIHIQLLSISESVGNAII